MTAKMTVTSVVVARAKLLFCMCDCTVDTDVGTGEFSYFACAITRVSGHGLLSVYSVVTSPSSTWDEMIL